MQNSTPNPSLHSATATASTHEATERAALAAAYERARERVRAGTPITTAWSSLLTGPAEEFPDEKTTPCGPAVPDAVGAPDLGVRLTLDEVLLVLREPIEWAIIRAERQAQGDPADLAALARLRTAYHSRLVWFYTSGALGKSHPDVRPTDVVIAMDLLARSIDPNLAQRAAAVLRDVIRNVLTAIAPLVEAHHRHAMEASRTATSCWLRLNDVLALFGAPRVAHPPTSAGRCPHGHPL